MKKLPKSLKLPQALFFSALIPALLLITNAKIPTSYALLSLQPQLPLAAATSLPTFNPLPTSASTPQPTPTSTPTFKPTAVPVATQAPTPKPTVTPTPVPNPSSSIKDYILAQINSYRASKGLGAVQTNVASCSFAQTRAQEITSGFNHDGFTNRLNAHTLPYSSFRQVTENIARTSDYKEVETMWANSSTHAANMSADTPFVCVGQSGDFFAMEGLKP